MERQKYPLYRTSTGILIGEFYEKKPVVERSYDMDMLQIAYLVDPAYVRREKIKNIIYALCVAACFVLLLMFAR